MKETKCYYATAHCFVRNESGCYLEPSQHRYFLLMNFEEDVIQLVNEQTLSGNWRLKNGNKEHFSFERTSVSNGRELSDFSEYTGQSYKRTPSRKTFVISQSEFLEHLDTLQMIQRQKMA